MAQRKYQPAARGRGFNPVSVSDAEITRMSQESERILRGMSARKEADLENRRRILEDMEKNANYYEKTRKRDFDIASTNLENRQKQLQYDEATRQTTYRQTVEGANKIFGDIASLSNTAAKRFAESKIEKDKKDFEEGVNKGIANAGLYTPEKLSFIASLNENDKLHTLLENNARLAREKGFDPNSVSMVLNMSAKQRAGFLSGAIKQQTKAEYASFYNKKLSDPTSTININGEDVRVTDVVGNPAMLAAVQANLAVEYIESAGYPKNHELLDGVYQEIAKVHNPALAEANTKQTKRLNQDTLTIWNNNADNDWDRYGAEAFLVHADLLGYAAAHEWVKERATALNPDGTFVLSDEQWQNIDVNFTRDAEGNITKKGFEGSYLLDYAGRALEIRNLRKQKEREFIQGEVADSRNEWQRESLDAWKLYQQEPTRETLAAIEEGFSDNPEGLPEWVVREKEKLDPANAPYKQQLILTAKDAKERGMLTQELVTEIYSFDPKLGNELQAALDAQDPIANNPNFKAQLKAVQGFVKKPSASVPFPSDSNDSVRASRILGNELQRDTTKLAAQYGGSPQAIIQASDEAAVALQARIIKDSANPQGRYYRVYNPVTGLYSFPNLSDVPISQTQKSKEQSKQFAQAMQSGRQQELINTKFGVLTESELISEVKRISRPGYVPNMKLVMASKGVEGGLVAVLNKQIKLSGLSGLKPVQPPESLQRVGAYSPAAQRHLSRYLNADVSTRVHGFEGGKLNLEWNRHLVPAQYRESIEKHAKTYGVPAALISAKLEVESKWGTDPLSPAGAKGIAQFMPDTARRFGVNVNDDNSSIEGAAKYLKFLLNRYNNDPIIAAGAYNSGEGAMDWHLENPSKNALPAETVNHMKKVTKALYKYSGDKRLLQRPETMRAGSPSFSAAYQLAPLRPLKAFSRQVSSVTFDTGQPGIDIFFEDKQFPAVLPGVVKDISFQGGEGKGYGNYIVIESVDPETNQKVDILYAHLASKPNLQPGQSVRTGQIIGQQGGTGRVVSADGTIASIDFLRPAPRGSKDMTPYSNYESLRRRIANQFRS
jgi:murein DD-endopeptidase MepM/ murein hydrolase activator NlpD